jgi:hypothetical protein
LAALRRLEVAAVRAVAAFGRPGRAPLIWPEPTPPLFWVASINRPSCPVLIPIIPPLAAAVDELVVVDEVEAVELAVDVPYIPRGCAACIMLL